MLLIPTMGIAANCAGVRELAALADQGFSAGDPDVELFGDANCDLSRNQDGTQTYLCHWEFHYRAPGAGAVFEMLERIIPICARGAKALPADSNVNHPDSYDLRRFQRGNVVISTSLKRQRHSRISDVFVTWRSKRWGGGHRHRALGCVSRDG